MLKGTVETGRVLVNEYSEGLEIIIPPQKSSFVSGFLTTWLLAWSYGEIMVVDKMVNRPVSDIDAFILLWLGAWTLGGLLAMVLQLWNLKGREVITIDQNELSRSREYVWFSRSSHYLLKHIHNMRQTEIDFSRPDIYQGTEFWGLSGGAISFDYGPGTQKIALEIDEDDANELIGIIRQRYPDL